MKLKCTKNKGGAIKVQICYVLITFLNYTGFQQKIHHFDLFIHSVNMYLDLVTRTTGKGWWWWWWWCCKCVRPISTSLIREQSFTLRLFTYTSTLCWIFNKDRNGKFPHAWKTLWTQCSVWLRRQSRSSTNHSFQLRVCASAPKCSRWPGQNLAWYLAARSVVRFPSLLTRDPVVEQSMWNVLSFASLIDHFMTLILRGI